MPPRRLPALARAFHRRLLPALTLGLLFVLTLLIACGGGAQTASVAHSTGTATTADIAGPTRAATPLGTAAGGPTPPPTTQAVTLAPTASPTAPPTAIPATATTAAAPAAGPPGPVTVRVPRGPGETALTEERTLTAPEGFRIAVFAAGFGWARFMTWSLEGDLVLSDTVTPDGRVYVLPDHDRDGVADERIVFARDLRRPHGLAFHEGFLYVAEETRVVRFAWQGGRPAVGPPETIVPDLPSGGHSTRTIGFGPDGKLYLSIGSSCNVCEEADRRRAAIMRYNPDGSGGELYARGLRNAVGFVWRPGTDELWATNNGRDQLGDDQPPETINLVRQGQDFGWPYCHNGYIRDQQFGRLGSCDAVTRPAVEMQAHSAPLGLAFYTGDAFPAEYRGDLLVAFHGSWNRSVPTGFKLVRVRFADGRPTGEVEDFITGWLQPNGRSWGRPVDVTVAPDGSLYLSDDALGVVYRIAYRR